RRTTARNEDALDFRQRGPRLREMLEDGVGEDDFERAIWEGQRVHGATLKRDVADPFLLRGAPGQLDLGSFPVEPDDLAGRDGSPDVQRDRARTAADIEDPEAR